MSWRKITYIEQIMNIRKNDLLLVYRPSFIIPEFLESSFKGEIYKVEEKTNNQIVVQPMSPLKSFDEISEPGCLTILEVAHMLENKNWFVQTDCFFLKH